MSAAVVTSPEQDLAQQVPGWSQIARDLLVIDQPSLDQASRYVLAIRALQQQADETFDPIIRKAHEAHKEAIQQKKRICDPLDQAESSLKGKMGSYIYEQRLLREEEERRVRAEAERLAAEQREAEIEEAEAAGASREEIDVLAQAPLQVAPIMRATAPKLSGITARESWKADVTDLLSLVRYVAQNPQFLNLLNPNSVAIGAMARSLRSAMNIPGIKVSRESTIATRGRA